MSNSTRSNNSIRIIGFIAALASIGTACGGAPGTSETLTSPAGASGIKLESVQGPADDPTTEQALETESAAIPVHVDPTPTTEPTPAPEPVLTPEPTPALEPVPTPEPTPAPQPVPTPEPTPVAEPAPAPEPTPGAEPTVEPNVAPVIDSMRVTRHGLEVTVELNASDGNQDPLTLSVLAVDNRTNQQFTLTEQADAHTFTFNFPYTGSITLVGSVTDGQEEVTQVEHIDIATLKVINMSVGYVTVAKACMANGGPDIYSATGDSSLIGLETSDYRPNVYSSDTVDTNMTFQEPGGQLFRQPHSLAFEQDLGFKTYFEVHGQFGDIEVDYTSIKTEAGSFGESFWSPSNSACWLKVGYKTSVTDA
jgi:hypothetical protein